MAKQPVDTCYLGFSLKKGRSVGKPLRDEAEWAAGKCKIGVS